MANPNVEYLGVMAWAAQFQWIADRTPPGDALEVTCTTNKARVGDEVRVDPSTETRENKVEQKSFLSMG